MLTAGSDTEGNEVGKKSKTKLRDDFLTSALTCLRGVCKDPKAPANLKVLCSQLILIARGRIDGIYNPDFLPLKPTAIKKQLAERRASTLPGIDEALNAAGQTAAEKRKLQRLQRERLKLLAEGTAPQFTIQEPSERK